MWYWEDKGVIRHPFSLPVTQTKEPSHWDTKGEILIYISTGYDVNVFSAVCKITIHILLQ